MGRKWFYILFLLATGFQGLQAQDHMVSVLDGPVVKADSLKTKPEILPLIVNPVLPRVGMPSRLSPLPNAFETKEQRAARINALTAKGVAAAVDYNLRFYRPPLLSANARAALFAANFFLSNPYGFADGYVPLMNPSFSFITAYTPGMAPYDNPYSPDRIPQAIRLEYDAATGTYKQVMVPWADVQKSLSRSFGSTFRNEPVPNIPVTPVDRAMWR
jgi:hypothetical protein